MESILTSIKKLLGLTEEDTSFDQDVIMHINTVLMDLTQLKVGPSTGFMIEDKTSVWTDFVKNPNKLQAIKSYIYLRVRLLFDPPSTAAAIASMEKQVEKFEWLINVAAESGESEDSVLIRDLKERIESLTAEMANLETEKVEITNELLFCKNWFKDTYITSGGVTVLQGKTMTTIPEFDFSSVTNFTSCFQNCTNLENIPLIDTSNGTVFKNMFYGCKSIKTIPLIDTSNGTDFYGMFDSCWGIETMPVLNLDKATNFNRMFAACRSLTAAEINKLSGQCDNMFLYCYELKSAKFNDTGGVIDFNNTFSSCTKLESVTELNMTSCTNATNMFNNCVKLVEVRFTPDTINTSITILSPMLSDESVWSIVRGLAPTEQSLVVAFDPSIVDKLTDGQIVTILDKGWNMP